MSFAEIQTELQSLSVAEKLQAMEALWDELCRRDDVVPVPQWHKDILGDRERLVQEGKARFVDWETAKKRISEQTS